MPANWSRAPCCWKMSGTTILTPRPTSSTCISVTCAPNSAVPISRPCYTPYVAKVTVCMADRPGNIQLNRTTAFRLSIRYAIGFCLLTIIALVLVYVHILSNVNRQINAGLRAEIQSLALSGQASGTAALTRTIHARSSQASIDATDQGDAGPRLYLLVSASGKRLAGALPHWREALSQQGDNTLDTIMLHTPQALLHLVEDRPVFKLRSYQTILADGSRLLVAQALNEQAELRAELPIGRASCRE